MSEEVEAQDWRESFPEAFREAPFIKGADSAEKALEDIKNAAQWMGNSLRIPGPDATPEKLAEFRKKAQEKIEGLMEVPDPDSEDYTEVLHKLGMPKSADKYKSPEGIEGEVLANLKTLAFEMGMTQKQFDAFAKRNMDSAKETADTEAAFWEEQSKLLSNEWGAATADRMKTIANLLNEEGVPQELKDGFKSGKITSTQAKWLYSLAERMAEGGDIANQASEDTSLTRMEAESQMSELTERMIGMSPVDPKYKVLMQKRMKLAEMAFAE